MTALDYLFLFGLYCLVGSTLISIQKGIEMISTQLGLIAEALADHRRALTQPRKVQK